MEEKDNIQTIEEALSKMDVKIKTDEGESRDALDVLKDLAKIWNIDILNDLNKTFKM